jgi:MFS superfamily sulfate permease-like transporter
LTRAIPVSAQLPHSRVPTARRDLVAGVTVAALALPAAMAYAEVAGLSPVSGLYALLLPTVAYVLFGSSRQLIIGEILTARSFAGKHNQHVRASQELLAMGAANAAAGFTQGFSVGASGSSTAVTDGMGARS